MTPPDDHRPRTLLFLHGFMGAGNDWDDVRDALSPGFHTLAVDLPGHGRSTGLPEAAYTMDGAAQRLVHYLDGQEIRQCVVVGYSMGGRLALYVALQHPERCSGLVLESASPGLATAAERQARRDVDEARAVRLETGGFEVFLQEWYRQPLFASLARQEGLVEDMIARRRANDPVELAQSLRGMGTGSQPSCWERLAALGVSTCAVAGALDSKYVDLAGRMAAACPRMRVVVVPEAGHNVHAEQPRRFIESLHSFLNPS